MRVGYLTGGRHANKLYARVDGLRLVDINSEPLQVQVETAKPQRAQVALEVPGTNESGLPNKGYQPRPLEVSMDVQDLPTKFVFSQPVPKQYVFAGGTDIAKIGFEINGLTTEDIPGELTHLVGTVEGIPKDGDPGPGDHHHGPQVRDGRPGLQRGPHRVQDPGRRQPRLHRGDGQRLGRPSRNDSSRRDHSLDTGDDAVLVGTGPGTSG